MHARTAYLSLTRGDGGQNLIGTEIRELLGVLRSQELQMARATDGGQQFFTRANDFGFSKHPDETLRIWDKDQVFADLIYVIRSFRPDIIVNRFDHRTPGKTHGHHTSSAMLSVESFDKAADPNVYPEQLKEVGTWQPQRQFMNTSWWFYGSRENFAKADKTNLISVDAGLYYPIRGQSNSEISGLARSKHRSQGFGSSGSRGSYQEYLELINGDMPQNKENLFDGINTTWTRVKGGERVKMLTDKLESEYNFRDPSANLPALLRIYDEVSKLEDDHWVEMKQEQLTNIILQCAGIFTESHISEQQITVGDSIEIKLEATNRSHVKAELVSAHINGEPTSFGGPLEPFTENKWYHDIYIDEKSKFSNPYWLDDKGALGTYKVDKMSQRIEPQSPAPLNAHFVIDIDGRQLNVQREVIHKYVNPAAGEIRQPMAIVPPATMTFDKEMYLFADDVAQDVVVTVRNGGESLEGELKLKVPSDWEIMPNKIDVEISKRGFEQSYTFKLKAPKNVSASEISAEISIANSTYNKSLINIEYDHIPLQTILLPAVSRIVKVPLAIGANKIGYIMGAGDKMPESLASVGYEVSLIEVTDISNADLNQYEAIVIGVRAYNTLKKLKLYNEFLFKYAEDGGTLVTQYNTSRRLNFDDLAPFPLKLSRKRVTDEYAEMRILKPAHKVFNSPNKIGQEDFDNWVQERGLYFPNEWDDKYTSVLSSNDKGEDPLDGSLLIAPIGEGHFVYTSISWFRQLPAGVPGAYRLFANILALSDE